MQIMCQWCIYWRWKWCELCARRRNKWKWTKSWECINISHCILSLNCEYCILMFPPQAYITLWRWKFPCSMSVPFFFCKKDHLALAFCCLGECAACPFCCCTVILHNKLPYSPWHNERMKTSYNDPTDSEIVVSDFVCASSVPSILKRTRFLRPKKPRKGCALDSCKYGIFLGLLVLKHTFCNQIMTQNKLQHIFKFIPFSGAQTASIQWVLVSFKSLGVKQPGLELTTHYHLVPRLGMVGAILHCFVCLCGVHIDSFTNSHESCEIVLKLREPVIDGEYSFIDWW